MLKSAPVLSAPDFDHHFKLAVDASDVAAGAVLLQEDKDGVDHPICYFSKKFNTNQRNYSTVLGFSFSFTAFRNLCEFFLCSSYCFQ